MNAHFPFSPKGLPFFYGWVILVVSTLGVLASVPGQTVGVSVFNNRLIEATGLSRLAISNAYLAGTLCSGLLLPWGGTLLDRWGARRTALTACIGLATTLVGLSYVDRFPGTSVWIVQLVVVIVLFFCLRFSGQGLLTMVSRTMLGRWFNRRRGLAAGISGVFVGYGFGAAPTIFSAWIEAATWRGAWRQMAFVVATLVVAMVWLFYRNDPESCGLQMDGTPPKEEAEAVEERHATRAEAIRTLAFWTVTSALAFQALVITGITFHITDLGAKVGLSEGAATAVFIPSAIVATAVGLFGGIIADHVRIRSLVALMMVAQAVGIFASTDLAAYRWLFVVGIGVSGGLFGPLSTVAFPRFFGRLHLGAIAGFEMMFLVIGSAIGPSLLAASERLAGSYSPSLYGALVLPVVALVMAMLLKEPSPSRA